MVQTDLTLPRGVRDTLPEKTTKRNLLIGKVLSLFEDYGYLEVTTPLIEYLDVITQGAGRDLKKRIVRFPDRATGKSVVLRPDFTPQIARMVATHYRDKKKPLRFSYHGSVIRLSEEAGGGQREIYQAGIELIGDPSSEADAEAITIAIEAMKAGGLKDFKVDIGQVEFVRGILDEVGIPTSKRGELLDAISKKDISRLSEMTTELEGRHREVLMALPHLFGGEEVVPRAEALVTNEMSKRALESIRAVLGILKMKGCSDYITIDLGEIRGFDYHTGVIFEGFVSGIGSAICGGGRYDNLLEGFGYPSPATGFAIDLDNLMAAIEKQS
jgi:ATP phosphoribosyltransferase regulatory subunit